MIRILRLLLAAVCIASIAAPAAAADSTEGLIVEQVTYGAGDVKLPGILVRPQTVSENTPAILALHGGGNSGLQRAMEWIAIRLARRGYVVLSGTYRPVSGRADDLADAMFGVDYLASLPYVDTSRIGMTGQSRGAGNSYRTAAADPRVKTILPISTGSTIQVAGAADQASVDVRMLSEQRYMDQIRGDGGFPHELPKDADPDGPPFPSIWTINKPILVLHGTWDLHAPAEGAVLLKTEVARRGASNIKVNLIEGMGHFFDTPKGDMLDEIGDIAGDWFDQTLRGMRVDRDFESPLTLPDTASWPVSSNYTVAEINYPAQGASIPGYLFRPTVRASGRGVVYAPDGHTGAEASRLAFVVKALADRGDTVLVTRYRGPIGAISDDQDLVGALDYLSRMDGVDAARLAAVGHGRGGMAALRAAAQDPRIKAVAALGAPSNLTRLIQGLNAYSPTSGAFQASRFTGPETYRALSPLYYTGRVKVPVLLVHGTLDLMVAPEHMLWNAVGLKTTGNTEVEMYMPPWDVHHFDSTFAWLKPEDWVGRIPDFLDRTMPDAP